MEQYTVTGMSCAACQARVEKAVAKVPGVKSVSVSLLTNSMGVEGSADAGAIVKAVEDAGYGAAPKDVSGSASKSSVSAKIAAEEDALKDRTTPLLKKRLIASIGFLVALMYFSMGVHMWNWPVPLFLQNNPVGQGIVQLLLAGIIMVINQKFFISGFKSLFHGAPNMDTLIALGSSAAYVYSTVMLFVMSYVQVQQGTQAAMAYHNEFYFESAGMILALITVGKMLESYSKGRTTDALKSLMKLAPKTANVIRDGQERSVSIDDVVQGDVFVVRPGENIPVDGVVLEGTSAVDESALTGESIPIDKTAGSEVSSATLNQSGFLKCKATRVGEDTTLSQIISMVSDAAATKAPVAKLADTISGYFVPAVILIALAVTVLWLILGQTIGFALARGISVLVVSCPCALGLATPVAIMVGNGMGAKHGILFKTAESLQETGNMQIVALDKTGTITSGKPKVTDICPAEGVSEDDLMKWAAALEKKSEHPLAKAIVQYADEHKIFISDVQDFKALPGNGLTASFAGSQLAGGSGKFIGNHVQISDALSKKAEELAGDGKTPLFFTRDDKLIGIIAVADVIKEDSAEAIRQMKAMGIHVVMLTGDNERTAEAIGRQAGVDEVIAGVLPEGKEAVIAQLQKKGKTAMIGDGINDAPALTRANIGMAIGAGTDVAIDAADVVLMKSRLSDAAAAIRLSRQTYKDIVENLFWALIYNVALVPMAAGLYAGFGLTMNPMWGAAAMSCSSVFVVGNALRLNLFDMFSTKHDKKLRHPVEVGETGRLYEAGTSQPGGAKAGGSKASESKAGGSKADGQTTDKQNRPVPKTGIKEDSKMKKTIKIEGMMCNHCEMTVKKALEALDGVEDAQVSHTDGQAIVTLSKDVSNDALKEAVEAKDYKVVGIQ